MRSVKARIIRIRDMLRVRFPTPPVEAAGPGVLLAALALFVSSGALLGQEVAGRLVSADGTPVPWALVRLVDSTGEDVAGDVTNVSGRFRLSARAAGVYRVRTERIGFLSAMSDPMGLAVSESRALTLTASEAPIELEALQVRSSKPSCGLHPEEGSELLAIWNEVRKALELQTATEESGLFTFHGEIYEYVVDLDGRPADPREAKEATEQVVFEGSSGFYAVDPELLVERGFGWEDHTFVAPDARTLLSEPFQASHCFRARRRDDRLGVAFEPDGGFGSRIEVEGTLWLDAVSGELQTLEYKYVSGERNQRGLDGGYLEFEQLLEGAWIVRRWWIRVPVQYRRRNNYFLEAGGQIDRVELLNNDDLRPVGRVAPAPELLETTVAAVMIHLPEEVVEELDVFRNPRDSAEVAGILGQYPDFASSLAPEAVAARAGLWRRARQPDLALEALSTASRADSRQGLVEVERARILFSEGRVAEAAAAFRTACATGDSLTLEVLWTDIRGLATSAELEDWETRPSTSRCAMLGDMIAERALRAGLPVPNRLALHYERLERARSDWRLRSPRVQAGAADSLGRHPDLEFDDRGLIHLRMGEPDEVAYVIAGHEDSLGNRVEGWRYDRPQGLRIFFFAPISRMGVGVADFRLLDAPWRAVGVANTANQLELVNLANSAQQMFNNGPLTDLYLSFQGLDPHYATLAYRARQGGTVLLQDLTKERQRTMADVAFAADSVPDAPDLRPSVRFAWEALRFFDPSSGSTTVWLLAGVRGADLTQEVDADGRSVYRVNLVAAVQLGTAVEKDSVETVSRLPGQLGEQDALVGRIPVSVGPGRHPFTLVVRDGNSEDGPAGNWSRGTAIGMAPSDLPEISDIAVAADSGGTWTRDGETFLAITPHHITGTDGEIHLYFEVYGVPAAAPYSVEIRVVPESMADRIWEVAAGEIAFRISFASEMPTSGGIGAHHLRLDLSDTTGGTFTLGIRITETETGRASLPATTPVLHLE